MTNDAITPESSLRIEGLDAMPEGDQAAIRSTVEALLRGFSTRNVALLDPVYTDDADWVNAFGSIKQGRIAIQLWMCRCGSGWPAGLCGHRADRRHGSHRMSHASGTIFI